MLIKSIKINNYRAFSSEFIVENVNIPDNENEGSGLTVFVGENGCGKTTILDAISLPLLTYKADSFSLDDLNDLSKDSLIELFAENEFTVVSSMPRGSFQAIGFLFKAHFRSRNARTYLSSTIVSDQKFIKADNVSLDENHPDLRLNVNNPFRGKRFDENEILYLDKNRTFQTRSGTYNTTKFDRIMEDLDYQYIKNEKNVKNISEIIKSKITKQSENKFLNEAIEKFEEISQINLSLNILDNWKPFHNAFFAEQKDNCFQINLNKFGSGYEMIFTLIYSFYLSSQSNKQLLILIDEPELHLHPSLEEKFVEFLLEISKESQIILTSHSPLFIKQLMRNSFVSVLMLQKTEQNPELVSIHEKALPYLSANEVNYLAFNFSSIEYHNELYGNLQEKTEKFSEREIEQFLNDVQGISKNKRWQREKNGIQVGSEYDVTLQTFIRNIIHHPENKSMQSEKFSHDELKQSIETMRKIILSL